MRNRYINYSKLTNSSRYYAPLRRGHKSLTHYATAKLRNPSALQRSQVDSISYIWSYGDRFYKLAQQYYDDAEFWWVIAWYNGTPTEAHLPLGSRIAIPTDIQQVLRVLGI